jgi:hypothetical protein
MIFKSLSLASLDLEFEHPYCSIYRRSSAAKESISTKVKLSEAFAAYVRASTRM